MLTPLPRPTRRRTPSPARTANGWLEGTYAMSELRVGLTEALHQLVHQPAGNTGERADPDSGSVSEGSNPSRATLCNFSISRLWWGDKGRRCIRGDRTRKPGSRQLRRPSPRGQQQHDAVLRCGREGSLDHLLAEGWGRSVRRLLSHFLEELLETGLSQGPIQARCGGDQC
jgi:hypothetical protein